MAKIVFDIGGTSMRVAVLPQNNTELIQEFEKMSTPENPEQALSTLVDKAIHLAQGEVVEKVVGGVPGILDENGKIFRLVNLPEWNGFDVTSFLKKELCEDVVVENDSALAGLGEAVYGAGKAYRIVGFINVGTGVGGAKVVDKKIDAHKYGFEPGHDVIDAQGGTTLEDNVSGHALEKKYGKHPRDLDKEVYEQMTPALALGLYNIILLWSPEVLILGGGLVVGENGYQVPEIIKELRKANTTLPALPEIRQAELGDIAGLHGARALMLG